MKRFIALLGAIALMVGLFAALPSVANAAASQNETASQNASEEPSSCEGVDVETGTGNCADVVTAESHSKSSAKSRVVSVNGVSVNSNVTVLANIRVDGTPQSQQDNCWNLANAQSIWTSYNASGTTGWHWKGYPKGYRVCMVGGKVRDPKCHNMLQIGRPHSNPPKNAISGKVKLVTRLKFKVEAVAKADEKVTSVAKAWCTTTSAYAYGEGRGSAFALAVGRARVSGFVLTKVMAQAEGAAAGDLSAQLGGKSVVQVRAEVRASAFTKATSEASAKATCSDTPQDNSGSIVEVEDVNDVLYGNSRTWRIRGIVPEGQKATLRVSARIGALPESDKVIPLSAGPFDISVHYTAPTEGSSDTLTAKLFGSDGVKDDEKSDTFELRPNPVDPL